TLDDFQSQPAIAHALGGQIGASEGIAVLAVVGGDARRQALQAGQIVGLADRVGEQGDQLLVREDAGAVYLDALQDHARPTRVHRGGRRRVQIELSQRRRRWRRLLLLQQAADVWRLLRERRRLCADEDNEGEQPPGSSGV